MKKGLLITLEGGDGAGKTTAAKLLKEALEKEGHVVTLAREPGGTALGEQVRALLLASKGAPPIDGLAELLLFLAARAELIKEVIRPVLKAGNIVICDRFNDSSIVYQGIARGLGQDRVQWLCAEVCQEVIPAITLLFDIDPTLGLARAAALGRSAGAPPSLDRIESEPTAFHMQVREGFLSLAHDHPHRFTIIDASQPVEVVVAQAIEATLACLRARACQ